MLYVFIHVVISPIIGIFSAKNRLLLVQWLTSLIPSLKFPPNVTDGELRACLSNGTVLCQILNKLRPGIVNVVTLFNLLTSSNCNLQVI